MASQVFDWIRNSAALRGDRTVYSGMGDSISFGDLERFSASVATWVAKHSDIERPVAVMTGRNVFTPACYMGVARAGCFYAPMDAEMPHARLVQIMGVTEPSLMIADMEHLEIAKALAGDCEIAIMEEVINEPIDEDLVAAREASVTESSPLYMIFTSGSTGVPKGVLTSHRSLIGYLDGLNEVIHLDENDIIGNQAPLDYIAAIRDMYLPLMTGARTVMISKTEFAMPDALFRTLNENKITILCWSAAGLEIPAKLGGFEEGKPEYIRTIVFSGSVISNKYLRIWQENLPDVTFINQYGPTEATASCTYYVIKDVVNDDTVLPIGRAYKHYQILLLAHDEDNDTWSAVPDGEMGEICVKGPCLAIGYYRSKEQTDKVFMQNPLNKDYPELIYLTGDLGHIGEDGELYFHGRKDRQIKHMGHRVELAEIEAYALTIEGITECASLYDKKREHIYLFYAGEPAPKEITISFRADMPAFMVPRKIVQLDDMPHLPNGKIAMRELADRIPK
ncbi:MAG: amino acid adenylation domain-containing protein [Clostridiales bacterium]|nr:amino acid adenylation domain-containing protein [Clostridiales bacterium]